MITYHVGLCDNSNWDPNILPHVEVVDDIECMSPSLLAEPGLKMARHLDPLKAVRVYVAHNDLGPRIAVNANTTIGCIELALSKKYWATDDLTHYCHALQLYFLTHSIIVKKERMSNANQD